MYAIITINGGHSGLVFSSKKQAHLRLARDAHKPEDAREFPETKRVLGRPVQMKYDVEEVEDTYGYTVQKDLEPLPEEEERVTEVPAVADEPAAPAVEHVVDEHSASVEEPVEPDPHM